MTALAERLESVWQERPGLAAWAGTVDHKRIGLRYLYTGFAFFVLGGLEALLIRAQLARADLRLLDPETYN
ncbi:MAG: cytochrome ubiquinol oxidase subunit I, partial [Acidimicrobiia bacterium]